MPKKAAYKTHLTARRKHTEQNQFCIAFPSNSFSDDDRFAMNLLSTVLGGGVSSRLFQNIREKHGLCYSIYSFQSAFSDGGLLSVATAVGKETEMRTLSLIGQELRALAEEGVTEEELGRAREQAKSSLVMGLESTSARMLKLGNSMMALDYCMTTDEIIQRYDAVTRGDILRLAQDRFNFERLSLSALGKMATAEGYLEAIG
jgi:predicted Zn-dependent peptidase